MAATTDQGAEPAATARRARPCGPQSRECARAVSSSSTMPSVTSTAVRTDRVDRRQSSSAPVNSNSNSAASVSSAAIRRSRMRRRAAARSSSDTVTATSGSSDGERMMKALGIGFRPAFELEAQGHRHDAGLEQERRAGERGAPGPGQRCFRDDRADVARRIGRIEHGLDASQLQALGALREEERCRSGQAIVGHVFGSSRPRDRFVRAAVDRQRHVRRFGRGHHLLEQPAPRRLIALIRRGAAPPGRAAPRAPPCRGGWSTRRIHPPPRPSAATREVSRSPPSCVRSITTAAMAMAAAATRPPAASRPTARVTKGGKVIRSVIVECQLC